MNVEPVGVHNGIGAMSLNHFFFFRIDEVTAELP